MTFRLVGATAVAGLALAALIAIALWYAADRGVPHDLAVVLLPAFLFEVLLYLLSGLRTVRERLEELRPTALALLLTATAPISYLLYTVPLHTTEIGTVAVLLALVLAATCWFPVLGRHSAADAGFLVLLAVPVLADLFGILYPSVTARVPTKILGVIMWYRTGLISALLLRRMEGIGFGFLPRGSEWRIGIRNYVMFLPGALALALITEFARPRDIAWEPRTLLLAILTFLGVLWVLAVAEEFFFRGLLQQLLQTISGSQTAGLVLASVIFGAAHLGYRDFPNWRFAALATLAGIFYGRAFQQAGSIRAAMVTHALVVTTWKTFLS